MKSVLNVEKGYSTEKLTADLENFKKQVMYCEYGLKLREIYPSSKALKLMLEVIRNDTIDEGN